MSATAIQPPQAPRTREDQDFGRGVRISLVLHVIAFASVLIKTVVFPGKPELILPALRVDVVGLPDLLKSEQKNLSLPPLPVIAPKPVTKESTPAKAEKKSPSKPIEKAAPDEMVLHPKREAAKAPKPNIEKRNRSALDRIKALSKINSWEKNEAKAAPVIKGNRISKGTSLSAEAREAAAASYYDSLRDKLNENFGLPAWLQRQNLSAQVQLFIDARGQLHAFRFLSPSGNPQFDSAVKKAVTESQPYPLPPEGLAQSMLTDGISVGFPL